VPLAPDRTCGTCDLCCTVLQIDELDKPSGKPCQNLLASGGGCGVWGRHPQVCKAYACLWRASDSLLPEDLFPKACGFLLSLPQAQVWPAMVILAPDPAAPDAWNRPAPIAFLLRLSAAWNCAIGVVAAAEGQGMRLTHALTPMGGLYDHHAHPQVFPGDGASLSLSSEDYGPDRRPPYERMAEVQFRG
jgi:hypothetical protein